MGQLSRLVLASILWAALLNSSGGTLRSHEYYLNALERGENGEPLSPMFKANISQKEYFYKHRMLHEGMRRIDINSRRRLGEPLADFQSRRIHAFKPIGGWQTQNNILTSTFGYDYPSRRNRITEVDKAAFVLQVNPQNRSLGNRNITLRILKDEHIVYVDGNNLRWAEVELRHLPENFQSITMTCIDCFQKNVTLTSPYLNIITSTAKNMRFRRNHEKRQIRRVCTKISLIANFTDMPAFRYVVEPKSVQIGNCVGTCIAATNFETQHASFRHELAENNKKFYGLCCIATVLDPLKYMVVNPNNPSELKEETWANTIIRSCNCQ